MTTDAASTTTPTAADRAARLGDEVTDRGLDALLVTNVVNVRWLTGFTGSNAAGGRGPARGRFVPAFRSLTQAAEQLHASWTREVSPDLLAGIVGQLPAEGTL